MFAFQRSTPFKKMVDFQTFDSYNCLKTRGVTPLGCVTECKREEIMTDSTIDTTRDKILDQAERLFASKGFDAVSIREITGAAGSNLAAVNYHFGNKSNLYLEVFRERWIERTRRVRKGFAEQLSGKEQPALRDIVESMARSFVDGPLSDDERDCHVQLMQRELTHPGGALKMVVEEVMLPYQKELNRLVRPNLPPRVGEEELRLCLLGILGMTLYFTFARPAVSMVLGREYDRGFKAELIRHITDFALNGFNKLKKEA